LALHSKQNADLGIESSNQEKSDSRKIMNPFAAEEDDDSDEDKDFTIGDLEVEEEGKRYLPSGTGLLGNRESLLRGDGDKNVGNCFS
jgi:hypothetical protein